MEYLPGRFGHRSGLATPTTTTRARLIRRLTTRQMENKRVRVPTSDPDVNVEVRPRGGPEGVWRGPRGGLEGAHRPAARLRVTRQGSD
eukprot:471983-Prorocentrum_minimum.AAC.1